MWQTKPKLGNLDASSSYLFSYLVYATISLISLVAQMVKHLPAMWETRVQSLRWEDLLEKEMAWKIPWTKEPGRLQSMGLQRVRHN